MPTQRSAEAVLAASERACWFLVERGSFDATVAEIAEAIGLHERTFYRYFPTKPDAIRPVLDWGAVLMADRLLERTDTPLEETVAGAFEEIVGGANTERTKLLFPLVFADPSLRAVLLAVYHDAESELRAALAVHTGAPAMSAAVYLAAARIVTATRLALELQVDHGLDPVGALRGLLGMDDPDPGC